MALQMGRPLPLAAAEAFVIVETGCKPTLEELDAMPQKLVDSLLLYGAVKTVILEGGVLKL